MGRGEMNFIYFEKNVDCNYPVGVEFSNNFDYIKEAANTLHTAVDKSKSIALVCRGTSGCIIAGAVGYLLKKKGREVTVIVSRKSSSSHGSTMDGWPVILVNAVPVVIDDFMSSGATINNILAELDAYVKCDTYPFLCISNYYNKDRIESMRHTTSTVWRVANRFDTIICNSPSI